MKSPFDLESQDQNVFSDPGCHLEYVEILAQSFDIFLPKSFIFSSIYFCRLPLFFYDNTF